LTPVLRHGDAPVRAVQPVTSRFSHCRRTLLVPSHLGARPQARGGDSTGRYPMSVRLSCPRPSRRNARRWAVVLALCFGLGLALGLLPSGRVARACSCATPLPPGPSLAAAGAVFDGTVTRIEVIDPDDPFSGAPGDVRRAHPVERREHGLGGRDDGQRRRLVRLPLPAGPALHRLCHGRPRGHPGEPVQPHPPLRCRRSRGSRS